MAYHSEFFNPKITMLFLLTTDSIENGEEWSSESSLKDKTFNT
jgi:hypothetical protein